MKRCVYAGSFDPITNGHVWMIEQGMQLFDELVVAIGVNSGKQYSFTLDERTMMLHETTRKYDNVKIDSFENQFLVNYSKSIKAQFILRGIRNESDFEYERTMRLVNADLNPKIATVFLMPPREIAELSSSFVRGLIGPAGWEEIVQRFVPKPVYDEIIAKFGK